MPVRRARSRLALAALLAGPAAAAACRPASRAAPVPAASYDLVISGGRVVDGTGNPWFLGDVAVRGDRIAAVGPAGSLSGAAARERLDARGLVIAPGFIDVQAQSYDAHLSGDGRVVSKIAQGVTTEVLGEGGTPAPANAAMLASLGAGDSVLRRAMAGFTGRRGFGAWLDAMERHGSAVNVGSFLGAENPRVFAKGYAQGAASAAELDTMRRVVRDAMADGAFGVASALIYPPSAFTSTRELEAMAEAMAPYHGVYVSHIRSEDDSLLEALDEAMLIGRTAGVPVEIYHLKAAGRRNWGKAAAMMSAIDRARAAGQDVGATMYPYPASSNSLASCAPPWAAADDRLLPNLRDPATRARIVRAMADTAPGAAALCQIDGPSAIMVVGLKKPELAKYEGWRLDRIALDRHQPWAETIADLVLAEDARVGKITFSMDSSNVATQLRRPWVIIGSDAGAFDPDSARGQTHPRAYGTFARVLAKYVRSDSVLTLEDAVRRMSGATAARLGLLDRGLVRPGMYADLAVFDPSAVQDRATYERPHQLASGFRWVLVNGTLVWRDGRPTGALPGRAVRRPRSPGEPAP